MTDLQSILTDTLRYARERNYIGYDKHDGMSSRIRQNLPFENRWVNLVFQETIKRAPINLRPYLLVEQRPSPKGLSLFTMATLNAYRLTGEEVYRNEALSLADRVVGHSDDGYPGFCLGHNHAFQELTKKKVDNPGIVGTSFGSKALLSVGLLDDEYAHIAREASEFMRESLYFEEGPWGCRFNYTPMHDTSAFTINANALGARLFLDLYDRFGDEEHLDLATGILRYVDRTQHDSGGWMYTDPPSGSHLSMDNYHNGFIIESFLRYRDVTGSDQFDGTINDALSFYRGTLYEDDGAPNWDESSRYPKDVHAAATGAGVFVDAGDLEFAEQILQWTVDNLYAGDGQFYYQQCRFYTKRFTFMRWCQAWMAYALSKFLVEADPSLQQLEGVRTIDA